MWKRDRTSRNSLRLQPQTLLGVASQRGVLRVSDTPGIKQLVTKLFLSGADDFKLPEYGAIPS